MSDPKDPSKRTAIKYLISGAAAAACPWPASLFAAGPAPTQRLGGEENKLCHKLRDGGAFAFPKPSASHEIAIIGGGPSGLISAYQLHNSDFLLLEKEPRFGGNAISEEWRGCWYSTGAAYQMDDGIEALCREIGMPIHRIRSVDAAIIQDQLVPEFWGDGLARAPYPEAVKKNWMRFFTDMKKLDTEANADKLDAMTFAELLAPYGEEVKSFFDNFGPNNWGGDAENTSALIGAQSVTWGGGLMPDRFTWPGGLGRISLALEEQLKKSGASRLQKNATVLQVEQKDGAVHVSYSLNGELRTIAAKAAIVACPKFIAKRLIKGLDDAHFDAFGEMRYQPYVVVNVCFNKVVYNGSYDTNIPHPSPIVDFNVADFVINRDNKATNRPSVLTCYVPRPEAERAKVLDDRYVLGLGEQVVTLLDKWFPGSRSAVEEVHIYRRGHPMFVSAPGVLTRVAPRIRRPLGRLFFAHSDAEGGISEYSSALKAADRAVAETKAFLGKSAKQATAALGSLTRGLPS